MGTVRSNKSKGFTLIELLVVVSIITILATVGFVSYQNAQLAGRDSRRKQDLKSLQTALELYYQDKRTFPASAASSDQAGWTNLLGAGQTYLPSMPLDPTQSGTTIKSDGNGKPYKYAYLPLTNASGAIVGYRLCTNLENNSDKDRNVDPTHNPPQVSCTNDNNYWADFKIESD